MILWKYLFSISRSRFAICRLLVSNCSVKVQQTHVLDEGDRRIFDRPQYEFLSSNWISNIYGELTFTRLQALQTTYGTRVPTDAPWFAGGIDLEPVLPDECEPRVLPWSPANCREPSSGNMTPWSFARGYANDGSLSR